MNPSKTLKEKKITLWNEKYIVTKKEINVCNSSRAIRVFIRKVKGK